MKSETAFLLNGAELASLLWLPLAIDDWFEILHNVIMRTFDNTVGNAINKKNFVVLKPFTYVFHFYKYGMLFWRPN